MKLLQEATFSLAWGSHDQEERMRHLIFAEALVLAKLRKRFPELLLQVFNAHVIPIRPNRSKQGRWITILQPAHQGGLDGCL